MKRLIIGVLMVFFLCSTAYAQRSTVMKDSDGWIGGSGVASRVTGYVTDGGVTVWQVDSDGSVTGYMMSPPGYRKEIDSISGTSLTAGTVPSSAIEEPLDVEIASNTAGNTITGRTYVVNLTNATTTLSGSTVYGGWIGNFGASSEVTGALTSAEQGMSAALVLSQGQASGQTMVVTFDGTNTVHGLISGFSSGNSAVVLSGATLSASMVAVSWADDSWWITSVTGHSYRNR
jgi:hypothetical protein